MLGGLATAVAGDASLSQPYRAARSAQVRTIQTESESKTTKRILPTVDRETPTQGEAAGKLSDQISRVRSGEGHRPVVSTKWRDLAEGLQPEVMKSLGIDLTAHNASPIANRRDLIDSTIKYLIRDKENRSIAVLKMSSEIDPQSVAESTQIAEEIASSLKPDTGRHILRPLVEHQYGGRSVAIYPYLDQLKMFRPAWIVQRRGLAPHIMRWAKELSRQTVRDAGTAQIEQQYITPLEAIVRDHAEFGPQFVEMAKKALLRIDSGKLRPKTVAMHGDPWKNNILLDARNVSGFEDGSSSARFMFIDWDTGQSEGFPFFDLIRLSNTLRTRKPQMRRLIQDYCEIVEATPEDVSSYITAALGHTLLNLNNCPRHVVALSSQIFLEDLKRIDLI